MHFQYSFLWLHFGHYQRLLQFLCYILTVKEQEKLFNFQEQLSFQGTLCNFSSISAISSYTSVTNSRFYLIFNKLARDSLRLHHQLYKSFSLCSRIKKQPILSASPTAPHYARVTVRTHIPSFLCWTHTVNEQNPQNWKEASESLPILPHSAVRHVKSPLSVKKHQSWPPVTPDSWYSCSHPFSKQSTGASPGSLARAQIQYQVLCS